MKTTILICTLLLAGISQALAQDVIVFKDGEEIEATVKEITPTRVKYIRYDNQEGPLYTVLKKEIFMIKFENGTKEVMADFTEPTEAPSTASNDRRRLIGSEYKSPGLAFLFSFLMPGGGQYYNHQYVKGGIMTGLWVAGIATVAATSDYYYDCYYDIDGNYVCQEDFEDIHPATTVGGIVIAGTWLWSVIDAPVSASIINRNGTALLEFRKEDKYALKIDPFKSKGLGGSLTLNF